MRLIHFTDISNFNNCERLFFYNKIEGVPEKPSPILLVGTTYHAALACVLGKACPLDRCVAAAVKDRRKELIAVGVDPESLEGEIYSRLVELFAAVPQLLEARIHAVEKSFDNEESGMAGTVDLDIDLTPVANAAHRLKSVTAERCVWDWKSVTSDRRRSDRDARSSPQLAIYALERGVKNACFVELPRNPFKAIHFLPVSYTEEELERWRLWLRSQRDALLSRGPDKAAYKMTERKNGLCSPQWCPHFYEKCYPLTSAAEVVE